MLPPYWAESVWPPRAAGRAALLLHGTPASRGTAGPPVRPGRHRADP